MSTLSPPRRPRLGYVGLLASALAGMVFPITAQPMRERPKRNRPVRRLRLNTRKPPMNGAKECARRRRQSHAFTAIEHGNVYYPTAAALLVRIAHNKGVDVARALVNGFGVQRLADLDRTDLRALIRACKEVTG